MIAKTWTNDTERYAVDAEFRERKKAHARRRYALKTQEVQDYVRRYQWQRKLEAIAYLGGSCQACGFDHPAALQFHHRDPSQKSFTIDSKTMAKRKQYPWEIICAELDKCDLLCANCHFIHHSQYGLLDASLNEAEGLLEDT